MVRWNALKPGPSEVVFAMVLGMVLAGGRHALFNDPGTLWHLRLGRDILASGSVPRCDTLTFTRAATPWVDQSWGADVLLALVVDHAGWSIAVALAVILLALVYAGLARTLLDDGISPVIVVIVALLMAAIGCIHFLIRPHLFTIALVFVCLRICQKQHERGGWIVAWVPLLTAVLANLHGGFLALPAIALTAAIGHAVDGPWDAVRRREAGKFLLAFVASCMAAILNPYGLELYCHVGNLLVSSGVTALILEYQPAPFGKPEARVLEMVLLGLVALPAIASRKVDRYRLAHLVVWLHMALTSIRHAPLFAFAAAGPLALLLDGLPWDLRTAWTERPRTWLWIPALSAGLLALAASGVPLASFDPGKWPFAGLEVLNRQPLSERLFHEQDWGGLISGASRPLRQTFVDDRFEIFGKAAILEYAEALSGGPAWDAIHDREGITMAWLGPERGLTRRLLKEPGWEVLHRDSLSVIMRQRRAPALGLSSSRTRP